MLRYCNVGPMEKKKKVFLFVCFFQLKVENLILKCFSPLASPVHIVGGSHPQMAQPSKALNMFPRPLTNEGLVLSHMSSLTDGKEPLKSYTMAFKSGMNPLLYWKFQFSFMFLCLKSVFDHFQMSVDRCLYL